MLFSSDLQVTWMKDSRFAWQILPIREDLYIMLDNKDNVSLDSVVI